MGSSRWRACAALLLALLVGCIAPDPPSPPPPGPEPVDPAPDPVDPAPDPVEEAYSSHTTPRGTEVEAPASVVNQVDLFLLALEQIDELNFHLELPGWTIKIVPPDGEELTNSVMQRIVVRWRAEDQEPRDAMLPNLKKLMDGLLHH